MMMIKRKRRRIFKEKEMGMGSSLVVLCTPHICEA